MWAMIVKEFRQLRRDRRTLAMMIVLPVLLLIVFGYAASFDVSTIPTVAAGPQAAAVTAHLGRPFDLVATAPDEGRTWAEQQLRDGKAAVAIVAGTGPVQVLIDGSQLFTAKAALAALAAKQQAASRAGVADPAAAGDGALQPRAHHQGHHDPGPVRGGAGVHRDDHHQPRGGP